MSQSARLLLDISLLFHDSCSVTAVHVKAGEGERSGRRRFKRHLSADCELIAHWAATRVQHASMAKMLSPRPDGYPVYVAGGLHDGTITGPIDPAPDDHMLGHCVKLCVHPRSRSLGMSSAPTPSAHH